nr:unnamed protein product [Callosobruchus analis]
MMCGVAVPNSIELQKHLDKHLDYSVPCKYCDKSFLSESARNEHHKEKHRGNRCRRLYRSKKLIIDRVDFKSVPSGNKQPDSTYRVYMMDNTLPVRLDVNVGNLNTMNINVCTEDDIPSEPAEVEETSDEGSRHLLPSSEMLEDHMDMGESCNNASLKMQLLLSKCLINEALVKNGRQPTRSKNKKGAMTGGRT